MLHHAPTLLLTSAVLTILALSERGVAEDVIHIEEGCYKIGSHRTCPPEISGYVPVVRGPGDVLLIDPFGNIREPYQYGCTQQQQQQGKCPHQGPVQDLYHPKSHPQQNAGQNLPNAPNNQATQGGGDLIVPP